MKIRKEIVVGGIIVMIVLGWFGFWGIYDYLDDKEKQGWIKQLVGDKDQ